MSILGVILVRMFPALLRIRTEYVEILRISPFPVRMREKAGKMRTRITSNMDPGNICWSSRHVLKTSSTHFQRNNFTSSKASWRRLQDVLEDKKPSRWRHLEDISWRCLEDTMERDKILTGDLTNLNVYLTNLYFTNLYLAILRRIQNALIRTQ